jgi:branched-chain amino acid transport system permease protein
MLPQMLVDGLTLGLVYAIVAIGFSMVYGALEFINFAHGDIFMVGAFIGTEVLLFCSGAGLLGSTSVIALVVALVLTLVITGLLGVAMERIAYRPLRNAPRLVPLISAFGVSFFLEDAVRMIEGVARGTFYLSAPGIFTQRVKIGSLININVKTLIVMGIGILMMVILTLFVTRTKIGKAIRAVAQDKVCASLMGISVDRVISITFLVGAGMGGAAGLLYAMQYNLINPLCGFLIGIKAFTAAVLGGIGNIPGAMVGGILLGLVESLGSGYLTILSHGVLGSEYKDVFAFAILIIILICKPSGLFGKQVSEKV